MFPARETAGRRRPVAVRGAALDFRPYLGAGHPCYRCLFREPPPPDLVPRCEEAGILGAVAGVMGTMQAVEVLKELLGLGDSLDGTLLMYDALRRALPPYPNWQGPGVPDLRDGRRGSFRITALPRRFRPLCLAS